MDDSMGLPLVPTQADARDRVESAMHDLLAEKEDRINKIAELNRRIIALKVELNGFVPISRLPVELLRKIFAFYVTGLRQEYEAFADEGSYEELVEPYAWMNILHVCHRWRVVGREDPSLWTWIVPLYEDYVHEALSLSGTLPVTIVARNPLSIYDCSVMDALLLLFENFSWVREASLVVTEEIVRYFCPLYGSEPLEGPLLEKLDLQFSKTCPFQLLEPSEAPRVVFPKLKSLTSQGGQVPQLLTSLFLPTLTRLALVNVSTIPAHSLLQVIGHLPSLQSLTLSHIQCGPVDDLVADSLPQPIPSLPIHVPQLINLSLSDDNNGEGCMHILENLVLSANTRVDISISPRPSHGTNAVAIVNICMSQEARRPGESAYLYTANTDWQFIFLIIQDPDSVDILLKRLFAFLDVSRMTAACIEGDLASDTWGKVSEALPRLEELSFCGPGMHAFLEAALRPMGAVSELARIATLYGTPPLFPSLRCLNIIKTKDWHDGPGDDGGLVAVSAAIESLYRRNRDEAEGFQRLRIVQAETIPSESEWHRTILDTDDGSTETLGQDLYEALNLPVPLLECE